ncbi:MAG: hypothetical protein Q9221_005338 [Calogaya cf. arnoldii]
MDRLPFELQCLIFGLVDRSDVPNLRRACKTFANIGLDYLLPEVEITFTRKSFDHLAEVVKHPILAHRVKSLVYHVDVLKEHRSKEEWMRAIAGTLDMGINGNSWKPRMPHRDAPKREWRLYYRNVAKACDPEWRYTEKQLATGYATYEKLWAEQQVLRDEDFGLIAIEDMVAQLPNLKHITLSNFLDATCNENNIVDKTFKDTLVEAFGDDHYYNDCGVPQLLSLLEAVRSATAANITLESLNTGLISWEIFLESEENLDLMREIFRPLKVFKMALSTSQTYGWRDPGAHDDEDVVGGDIDCQALLEEGRHLTLIQSMSNLQVLELTFHSKELGNFGLVSAFRDTYWPNLREVHLHFYNSTDEDLLAFLNRHSKTLKVVDIVHHVLTRGLWIAVFRDLRTSLRLEKFRCGGWLSNDTLEGDYWDFCGDPDGPIPLRESVEAYVLGDEDTTAEDVLNVVNSQEHDELLTLPPPRHV